MCANAGGYTSQQILQHLRRSLIGMCTNRCLKTLGDDHAGIVALARGREGASAGNSSTPTASHKVKMDEIDSSGAKTNKHS
jgi:hypothetical protein